MTFIILVLPLFLMHNQLVLLGDVAATIYEYLEEFSDMTSVLVVSKDFYELRWKMNWDKDYVNPDFVNHLDYYDRFTKVFIPSNFFSPYEVHHATLADLAKIPKQFFLQKKSLPKHTKKIKFFDFLCNMRGPCNDTFWEPAVGKHTSYKEFNTWIQTRGMTSSDHFVLNHSPFFYTKLGAQLFKVPLPYLHDMSNVEKVQFTTSMLGEITADILPKNLKTLIIPNHYVIQFRSETLPKNLKKLHMGWRYPHELKPGDLPEGLEHLELNHDYDFPLKPNVLPTSLTYLKLGANHNQVIEPGVLHEGLKILELGECYVSQFPKNAFPESLDEVKHPKKFWSDNVIHVMYFNQPAFQKA